MSSIIQQQQQQQQQHNTTDMVTSAFGDDDSFLRGYDVSFSWEYPDDFGLKDVQDSVCFVYDEQESPRSESQYISECIQGAGAGVLLLKPHPGNDSVYSEMHFQPSKRSLGEFCMVKLSVVSESRHLELYLDDIYEKTSKGVVITLQKGGKLALYENHFDLSAHVQSSHKFSLRFLSLGERNTMRLQSVIVKVTKCNVGMAPKQPSLQSSMGGQANVDVGGVRDMLQSMGLSIPSKAGKLMTDIEHQQKQIQMTQLQGLANVGLMAQLQTITQQQQTIQQQAQSMNLLQAMFPQKPALPTGMMNGHSAATKPLQRTSAASSTRNSSRSASPQHQPGSGRPATNGHVSPEGKYPISRESVEPPPSLFRRSSSASTLKSTSMLSLDLYDGYGAPSMQSKGSVLENAMRNEGYSRDLARSRASDIEEQNLDNCEYEKTQIEMVKDFLRSEDAHSRKLTITKLPPRHPDKPPRGRPNQRGGEERRPRPHSMSSLPATSEADFTKLLTNLMGEEKNGLERPGNEEPTRGNNARWEAYLRSRVRASHRLSSVSSPPSSDYHSDVASSNHQTNSCPRCGCPGCLHTYGMMQNELQLLEKRMAERMDERMHHMQRNLEERMNKICELIVGGGGKHVGGGDGGAGYGDTEMYSSAV